METHAPQSWDVVGERVMDGLFMRNMKKEYPNVVYNYYCFNGAVFDWLLSIKQTRHHTSL